MTDPAAEIVADDLLFYTGRAIHSRNFDHFKVHFALPHVLELEHGTQILKSEADIKEVFDRVQEHIRKNEIHELIRTVVSAEFIDSETVGSTHVSKAVKRDGTPVGAPYPTYSVIVRRPEGWQIVRSCVVFLANAPHDSSMVFGNGESNQTN